MGRLFLAAIVGAIAFINANTPETPHKDTVADKINHIYNVVINGKKVNVQAGPPSFTPTPEPTAVPSIAPTGPTGQPTQQPTMDPSRQPTSQPSRQPTRQPTSRPSRVPTHQPTRQPTSQPSKPSGQPSEQPTMQVINTKSLYSNHYQSLFPFITLLSWTLSNFLINYPL